MAKLLAYDRVNLQPVTIDTVTGALASLGGTIPTAEPSSTFPNRVKDIVSTYLGDTYLLYRDTTPEVHLSLYDGVSAWADVGTFPNPAGNVFPVALQVHENRLHALVQDAGTTDLLVYRSDPNDGTVWTAGATLALTAITPAGKTMQWRSAIFVATAEGITWYDPDGDNWGALDTGDDAGITGAKAAHGAFATIGGALYYILPTDSGVGTPSLYRLAAGWLPGSAPPAPAWANLNVLFPAIGGINPTGENATYALFVNKAGLLTAWYSGTLGTKVVTIQETGSGFELNDITTTVAPGLSAVTEAGWSVYVDDRRSSNEQHTILGRNLQATPNEILVYSWDGSSEATLLARLDGGGVGQDLILPDDELGGEFRAFTNLQPSAHLRGTNQPFPGRIELSYTVRDSLSRPVNISGEYSLDAQTWSPMTQGSGDDGNTGLTTSPAGNDYTFFWDAFQDLAGDLDLAKVRIVARISGV